MVRYGDERGGAYVILMDNTKHEFKQCWGSQKPFMAVSFRQLAKYRKWRET